MAWDASFPADAEFQKLLAFDSDIDLVTAALEIARDADPHIDFAATQRWLDQQGTALLPTIARTHHEWDALQILCDHLGQQVGLRGSSACYGRAESSFLHRVIETRRGLPITLSLIYMAVAGRVGIDLAGVASPAHFLSRCEAVQGPIFVDAFAGGRLLTEDECVDWLSPLAQMPAQHVRPLLKSAAPRIIITRMLYNLKQLYVRQQDWDAALGVQRRLSALQPAAYPERRDLALFSARAGHTSSAIELLEHCLRTCPGTDRELLSQTLAAAHRAHARWN